MKLLQRISWLSAMIILILPVLIYPGFAEEPASRVLILPFKANATQDLTYIQEGILDMLSTRLAQPGKVEIMEKALARQAFTAAEGRIDAETARAIGRKYSANYVIYGSLTMIGQNFSLDSSIISVLDDKPLISAHTQSEGLNGIIPKVNLFAEDINARVFKRTDSQPQPAAQTAPSEEIPAYRRHPDTLLIMDGLEPGEGASLSGAGFWRSPFVPAAITGLDVADVDGDGKNEIIYSSANQVIVARLEKGAFRRLASFDGEKSENFFTLDAADINGNGKAEIFISNQFNNAIKSYVLEWEAGKLVPIVKHAPWFYRIINLPDGPALFGQSSSISSLFFTSAQRLVAKGRSYEPAGAEFNLKGNPNVLSFSLARFAGEDGETLITINEHEELRLYAPDGNPLWEGKEMFGGSVFFLNLPAQDPDTTISLNRYYYIPPRILTVDSDGDRRQDIIISKSRRSAMSGVAPAIRPLNGGAVHALTFNEMSLKEKWRTPNLSGYPVDYQVKDYNNDGQPDLIIAVLYQAGGSVFSNARSNIIAYSLEALRAPKK